MISGKSNNIYIYVYTKLVKWIVNNKLYGYMCEGGEEISVIYRLYIIFDNWRGVFVKINYLIKNRKCENK